MKWEANVRLIITEEADTKTFHGANAVLQDFLEAGRARVNVQVMPSVTVRILGLRAIEEETKNTPRGDGA